MFLIVKSLPFLVLLFTLLQASPALSSETSTACFPTCRDGYFCHEGQCVSKCNPGCDSDELCSNEGKCVLKQTAKETPQESHKLYSISAKAGLVFPTEIWVDHSISFDTETSYGFGADFNYIVIPRLSLGVYLTLANTVPAEADYTATYVSVGGSIRPRFSLGTIDFRPGFLIGYNQFTSEYAYADGVYGMNIGFSGLIAVPFEDMELVIEPGFYSQPVGGNDSYTVTFVPSWFLLIGAEI